MTSGDPRRGAAGTVVAVLLAIVAGCGAPGDMLRRQDDRVARVSRGLADVADAIDRAFGEPRIADRERLAMAKVGPALKLRENNASQLFFPVMVRMPLPALERRTNIFLQVDAAPDNLKSVDSTAASISDTSAVKAAAVTRFSDYFDAGLQIDVQWEGGPQTGLTPFIRWEWRPGQVRLRVQQDLYGMTNTGFGWKSGFQVDRVGGDVWFVRFLATAEHNEELRGTNLEHAVIYRHLFSDLNLALSGEAGVSYNLYNGDPAASLSGPENDPDEAYLRLRVTGKVFRPWLEYEVAPALFFPWRHHDRMEVGLTFMLRCVFEHYLMGPKDGAGVSPVAPAADEPEKP